MEEILKLSVAIVGLVIYYIRPRWLFLYWIISVPVITPFLCIIAGITDIEDTVKMVHGGYFMHLNFFVLIESLIIRKKDRIQCQSVIIATGLLFIYFILHALATNGGLLYAYWNIKNILLLILPFYVLCFNQRVRPQLNELYIVAWAIIIIETIAVFLNFAGIRFYVATYSYMLFFGEKLATGTFHSTQMLCNYITTIYLFICIAFFCWRKISTISFVLLSVMSVFCLLSGGSKLCIILAVFSFFLSFFFYQRKHRILLLTMVVVGYVGVSALLTFRGGEISSNEGVNRIVNELSLFTQSKMEGAEDNTSTVGLSEKLLEAYFYRSPFIGNGLSAKGDDFEYDIEAKNNDTTRTMKADAKFAFLLVDIGLIGVFLYLLLFYQQFKCIKRHIQSKGKYTLIVVFLFYLLFSITESGFWDVLLFPIAFIFYFAVIRDYNENCLYNS